MTTRQGVFRDRYGLHPRAAMRMTQAAGAFRSRLTIAGPDGRATDVRSMISLVSAGIRAGDHVTIGAEGEDEAEAADAVRQLVEAGVCHPGS